MEARPVNEKWFHSALLLLAGTTKGTQVICPFIITDTHAVLAKLLVCPGFEECSYKNDGTLRRAGQSVNLNLLLTEYSEPILDKLIADLTAAMSKIQIKMLEWACHR